MPRTPQKIKGIHSYQLSNGDIRYKFVIYCVRAGQSRPFWFFGFTTQTAADNKRIEVLAAKQKAGPEFVPEEYQKRHNNRKYHSPDLQLFEDVAAKWIESKQTRHQNKALSESSLNQSESSLQHFLLPLYKGHPMTAVTRVSWVVYLEQMEADGHSWYIRRRATASLTDLMNYAANRGYVSANPLHHMASVLGKEPTSERMPLTEAERVKFLAAARKYRGGRYYALLHGLLEGPRPGEQLALELDGFYPEARKIRLAWNYTNEGLKAEPKDKEPRYLDLTEETTRLYIIQAEKATREQIAAGLPPRWLFPSVRAKGPHKIYSDTTLRNICASVCRLAGIRRMVPYEGRTTAGCTMRAKGASLAQIAEHLGHSSTKTTHRYTKKWTLLAPPSAAPGPRPVDLLAVPNPVDVPPPTDGN